MLRNMASGLVTSLTRNAHLSSSKCSVILGILFTIFFVLCIAVVVVWAVLSDGFHNLGGIPDLCATKACIAAASRMAMSMSDEASACDDFYQLSCGTYHQNSLQLSYSEELANAVLNQIHGMYLKTGIITSRSAINESSRSLALVRELYASCLDVNSRNNFGAQPFIAALRNFPCGPILKDCTSFNADFYSFERHAGMLDWLAGSANLINSDRDVHPGNRGMIIMVLKVPNLGEILWQTKATMRSIAQPGLSEYEPLMIVTLKQQLLYSIFDQTFDNDLPDKEVLIDEVAELIVEIDKTFQNLSDQSMVVTTISQLIADVPQINWENYLNAKLSSNIQWNATDSVLIDGVDSFRDLAALVARTPRRALANYLTIMTALNLRGYLYNATSRVQPVDWKECVQQLAALDITANIYAKSRQDVQLKEAYNALTFMKKTFLNEHKNFPVLVRNRISSSELRCGYPQRIISEAAVMQPYNNYEVISNDYFTSIVTALSKQRIHENAQIGNRLDSDDSIHYGVMSARINYNYNENTFVVPISFLQSPISLPNDAPYYTVYGTLGVVFSQMLSRIVWESPESVNLLNQALQCIEHPFLSIQSTSTVSIAQQQRSDIIYALHLADAVNSVLNGYSFWRTESRIGEEARLPSLQDYNTVQQLFLSFSTLYCNPNGQQKNSSYRAMWVCLLVYSIVVRVQDSTRMRSQMRSDAQQHQNFTISKHVPKV